MRLIDKIKIREFNCEWIETTADGKIIVTLGPYQNSLTLMKDYNSIIDNYIESNGGKKPQELTYSDIAVSILKEFVRSIFKRKGKR